MEECRLDSSGSGYGQMADSYKYSTEPLGSIRCKGFLDQKRTLHHGLLCAHMHTGQFSKWCPSRKCLY